MQKFLASAGAVGAAALDLGNNKATEVIEAAPFGVQQRRRSQAKKEEPAVLIQRSLAQHKASRVSTGRNAAAAWAWGISITVIVVLIIFLCCWFLIGPGSNQCEDVFEGPNCQALSIKQSFLDKADCPGATGAAGTGRCIGDITLVAGDTIKKKFGKDRPTPAGGTAACTCIVGNLVFTEAYLKQTDKVEFGHDLLAVTGNVQFGAQGTDTAYNNRKIDLGNLALIQFGEFQLWAGDASTKLKKVEAPCLQGVGKKLLTKDAYFLEEFNLPRLEEVKGGAALDGVSFFDQGVKSGSNRVFKANKLCNVPRDIVILATEDKATTPKVAFEFKSKDLVVGVDVLIELPTTCQNGGPFLDVTVDGNLDVGTKLQITNEYVTSASKSSGKLKVNNAKNRPSSREWSVTDIDATDPTKTPFDNAFTVSQSGTCNSR